MCQVVNKIKFTGFDFQIGVQKLCTYLVQPDQVLLKCASKHNIIKVHQTVSTANPQVWNPPIFRKYILQTEIQTLNSNNPFFKAFLWWSSGLTFCSFGHIKCGQPAGISQAFKCIIKRAYISYLVTLSFPQHRTWDHTLFLQKQDGQIMPLSSICFKWSVTSPGGGDSLIGLALHISVLYKEKNISPSFRFILP